MPRSNSYAKRVCERLARQTRACPCSRLEPAGLAGLAPRRCPASATLKRFQPDLNHRDSQRFKDEQVSWLSFAGGPCRSPILVNLRERVIEAVESTRYFKQQLLISECNGHQRASRGRLCNRSARRVR